MHWLPTRSYEAATEPPEESAQPPSRPKGTFRADLPLDPDASRISWKGNGAPPISALSVPFET